MDHNQNYFQSKITPPNALEQDQEFKELTSQEQSMVKEYVQKIDFTDSVQILQYGSGVQRRIADFSDNALDHVHNKAMVRVEELITRLLEALKDFSAYQGPKGVFSWFNRTKRQKLDLMNRYREVERNIDEIAEILEAQRISLMKDITLFNKMQKKNLDYYKELTMYILAGRERLRQVLTEELPLIQERAQKTEAQEDINEAHQLAALCEQFDKKLYDLELSRAVSRQMGPQLRLLQNSDSAIVDKIQSSLVNTIPLWKNQMMMALGLAHSREALNTQRNMANATRQILTENTRALKNTPHEDKEGVDLDTLKETNESLIETLDSLLTVQQSCTEEKLKAEAALGQIGAELRNKQ